VVAIVRPATTKVVQLLLCSSKVELYYAAGGALTTGGRGHSATTNATFLNNTTY
jgi:hypothetical protein